TSVVFQLDIDTEGADFLQQYVEGFRHARIHAVIAVDDVLVNAGTAIYVVRLHREHFLQRVGSTVSFQRPHFHLTEALATELRLTTQRLLGNQTVRAGRTRVHLVVNKVVQLEHVHVANGYRTVKLVTGTAIPQLHLAGGVVTSKLEQRLDFILLGTIEHWRRHRHTATEIAGQLNDLLVAEAGQILTTQADAGAVVDLVEECTQLGDLTLLNQHFVDALTKALRRQAKMHFKHLTDVHTRRNTQRVEDDVYRTPILVIRHVFLRHDHGDHTLVTVAAGHLVTRLHTTLDRQVNLDHLQHAVGEIITTGDFRLLVLVALFLLFLVRF